MVLSPKTKRRAFRRQLPSTKSELVFLEPSPNFCIRDVRQGVPGTRGRKCIKDSSGTDGCKLLCCKKGYNTRIETVTKRCSCKFYWCCKVKCKSCTKNETIHTCKWCERLYKSVLPGPFFFDPLQKPFPSRCWSELIDFQNWTICNLFMKFLSLSIVVWIGSGLHACIVAFQSFTSNLSPTVLCLVSPSMQLMLTR